MIPTALDEGAAYCERQYAVLSAAVDARMPGTAAQIAELCAPYLSTDDYRLMRALADATDRANGTGGEVAVTLEIGGAVFDMVIHPGNEADAVSTRGDTDVPFGRRRPPAAVPSPLLPLPPSLSELSSGGTGKFDSGVAPPPPGGVLPDPAQLILQPLRGTTVTDSERWLSERISEWARARGGDTKTVERNEDYLTSFGLNLAEFGYGRVPPTGITAQMVDRFKHDAVNPRTALNVKRRVAGRKMAPNHVANALPRVRLFCEYYDVRDSDGHLLSDQTRYRRLWRMPARPEAVYVDWLDTPGQLRDLLNAAAGDPTLQAMVVLTGPCQLRRQAAMDVRPCDLTLSLDPERRSTVRVIRGKFGKPQSVRVPPHVVGVLLNAVQGLDPERPIWPFGVTELWRRFDRASRDAKIRHTEPHTLRRSVAAFADEAGCRPAFIQARLNHTSWETTRRHYLRPNPRTDDEDMARLDRALKEG